MYIYKYIIELCQQVLIYNEETECISHTRCSLELPQSRLQM